MILQTNRLLIRDVALTDIDSIHELHLLPETRQTTEKLVNEWLTVQRAKSRTSNVFCIDQIDTNQFIGLIALNIGKPAFRNAEVWYKLHVAHWHNGYATEALTKVLDFGFCELNLHRIEAGCAVENIASINVLEKVGLVKEGMKRKNLPIRGE